MKLVNSTRGKELANNLFFAKEFLDRLRGLLGRDGLSSGEAIWIEPCRGIHTFGMNYPIDVIFLDRCNCVIALKENLLPNRITPIYIRARVAVELPAGTISITSTMIGDRIEVISGDEE